VPASVVHNNRVIAEWQIDRIAELQGSRVCRAAC